MPNAPGGVEGDLRQGDGAGDVGLCALQRRRHGDRPRTAWWQDARIVLGGVAPIPYRAFKAEAALKGKPIRRGDSRCGGPGGCRRRAPPLEEWIQGRADTGSSHTRAAVAGMTTDDWTALLRESVPASTSTGGVHPEQPVSLFEANLAWMDLTNVNFEGADLRRSLMEGCNLAGARFDHAQMDHANLRSARLTGASLRAVTLTSGVFQGADLRGAALHDARLRRVIFCDANLTGAQFTGANLDEADLRWATYALDEMTDADLSSARIR